MLYAFRCGGSYRPRHRCREDETRRGRPDRIADHGVGCDVAPHNAKAFGQRPFDDVDAVHHSIPLGDAGAAEAIKTDGVDLIEISQRPEFRREIADAPDRGDVSVHRIKGLKSYHLGTAVPSFL